MVRSLKNPVTPPGIDPGTVRLVAQRLNHYATPGPPMKQSTSGKYDDQEDTRISWKPKVHHRTYNSPKRKPYPTSNGFNPHGHIPISTISLVHMATLLSVRIVTLLYLRPTQSTWPHSYVHDQFSPHYPHSCFHNQSTVLPSTSRFPNATLRGYRHRYTRSVVQQWLAIPP